LTIIQFTATRKVTNPYLFSPGVIKENCNAELCNYSWCKAWELYTHFYRDIFNNSNTGLKSLHLGESGTFVTSLNHFVSTRMRHTTMDWKAVGINPHTTLEEMASIDMNLFYRTRGRWIQGNDCSGDITKRSVFENVLQSFPNKVQLVTANGAHLVDFDKIEEKNFQLKYTEIVTSLNVLRPGGVLMIRFFTIFSDKSVGLLRLLVHCFKSVHVVKPLHCSPDGIEVYIVCLGYCGIQDRLLEKLSDAVGKEFQNALIPQERLESTFVGQLVECNEYFADLEIQVIEDTLNLAKQIGLPFEDSTNETINAFIQEYGISRLEDSLHTVSQYVPPPPPPQELSTKIPPPPPPPLSFS
jgi:hypothetical protein